MNKGDTGWTKSRVQGGGINDYTLSHSCISDIPRRLKWSRSNPIFNNLSVSGVGTEGSQARRQTRIPTAFSLLRVGKSFANFHRGSGKQGLVVPPLRPFYILRDFSALTRQRLPLTEQVGLPPLPRWKKWCWNANFLFTWLYLIVPLSLAWAFLSFFLLSDFQSAVAAFLRLR